MFGLGKKKISIDGYKGVRDFYPRDKTLQKFLFGTMRKVVERYGYEEYDASLLEPIELYKAKSSEEIVNEQIYSFVDRGGRQVALRPEMTPTVSRMVGAKWQDLPVPVRWYSIPNVFRYEKPQRGRLREHWQLNVDMFGVSGLAADLEMISVAYSILKEFGATENDFKIKINSRELLDELFERADVEPDRRVFVYRLLDKKEKMLDDEFRKSLISLTDEKCAGNILEALYMKEGLLSAMSQSPKVKYLSDLINALRNAGITNIEFSPTLTRCFDYYTSTVFEIFDNSPENPRSIFGGGRYDELVGSFVGEKVPALGFGMGDVTLKDFLETHGLLPEINSSADLYICVPPETPVFDVNSVANGIREMGINVAVDISGRKLGDQLKSLDKRNIPFVIILGKDEIEKNIFTLRNTKTREEKSGSIEEIVEIIKSAKA